MTGDGYVPSPSEEAALHRIVRQEAQRVHRRFPKGVIELEDLVGYGMVAMLESMRRFDPSRGVSPQLFVRPRVRGAIIDGIKGGLGVFGRRTYRRIRQKLSQRSTDSMNADTTAETTSHQDVQSFADTMLESHPCLPTLETPEESFAEAQKVDALRAALAELNSGEMRVVRAMYDFSLSDNSGAKLARKLGVNRSQVCRRHQKILGKLRTRLRSYRVDTLPGD